MKYPNAFRMAPSNTQWDDAVRNYCLNIVKAKKVAVIGDTTGYGVTAVGAFGGGFKKDGAEVVYQANDRLHPARRDAGHAARPRTPAPKRIVVWSVSTGMDARMFNARAAMNWDVPFVGHPSMASGEIAELVDKPDNWRKVYTIGYGAAATMPTASCRRRAGIRRTLTRARSS